MALTYNGTVRPVWRAQRVLHTVLGTDCSFTIAFFFFLFITCYLQVLLSRLVIWCFHIAGCYILGHAKSVAACPFRQRRLFRYDLPRIHPVWQHLCPCTSTLITYIFIFRIRMPFHVIYLIMRTTHMNRFGQSHLLSDYHHLLLSCISTLTQ